jgi:putative SOS response-associated peptidase YedK
LAVDGAPISFAGIWETWRSRGGKAHSFATITTDANELLASIQDRTPVIIEKADWPVWLGEAEGDPAALNAARETLVGSCTHRNGTLHLLFGAAR